MTDSPDRPSGDPLHSSPLLRALAEWLREPPEQREQLDAEAHRQRIRSLVVLESAVVGFFILLSLARGQRIAATVHCLSLVVLGGLWLANHRLADHERPRHLSTANGLVVVIDVVVTAMVTGQNAGLAPWFLTGLPLLMYSEGLRATIVWAAVAAALIVGIEISAHVMPIEAEFIPNASQMLPGRLTLLALILGYAMVSRRSHNRQLARLAESERVNREQTVSLAVARDEALEAAREKARFLATMSHELRTPLNGVIGISELLRGTTLDEQQRHLAGMLQQSGRTLLGVINAILDFSKLEAGQFTIDIAPFDLRSTVHDVAELMRATIAPGKPVMVTVELDPMAPRTVIADEMRLRQVLLNLVGNALKFTSTGAVTIGVGPRESDRVQLLVRDTGIGIAPADRDRLFEPFTQADGSHARRVGGTGLGLTICRRLVELMGGAISLESEPGRGSTFRFAIQVGEAADDDVEGEPRAQQDGTEDEVATTDLARTLPLGILVVEDNPVNQTVILEVLRRMGYRPELAGDGEEALAASAATSFDLILMDVQLPGLDGLEVTRRIRARPAGGRRPEIFALTANVLPEQVRQCEEAGMDGFVQKPFSPAQIVAALRAAGGAPSKRRTRRTPSAPILLSLDQILDGARLAALHNLVPDAPAWRALISAHLDNSGELMQRIRRAIAAGDAAELERAAHSLGSSSAMFGANRVSQACRRIEAEVRGRGGRMDTIDAQAASLEIAYREARAELTARMQEQRDTTGSRR